jgi:hypothetical protein
VRAGVAAREGVVVATKGGYLPFDGPAPPGLLRPGDLVAGCHRMTPRYLEDQTSAAGSTSTSRPSTSTTFTTGDAAGELPRRAMRAVRAAFEFLEGAARDRRIGLYGTATWSGYRRPQSARDFLSLPDLVALAEEVGGAEHRFCVVQLPYNLAMTEAFTLANPGTGNEPVPLLESARRLDVYVMSSASIYQGQLAKNLPAVIARSFRPRHRRAAGAAVRALTPGVGTAPWHEDVAHVARPRACARCRRCPVEFQKLSRRHDGGAQGKRLKFHRGSARLVRRRWSRLVRPACSG